MISPDAKASELSAGEIAVSRVLEDRRWRTSAEIADHTELLPLTVRFTLRALAGRGLVRHSITGPRCGHRQITAGGVVQAERQRVARELP